MKLSFIILYVKDVKSTVAFYEKAFNLKCRMFHESGQYAEMDTGHTMLAFSQHDLIDSLLPDGFQASSRAKPPLGAQISFEPDDVDKAHKHVIQCGGLEVSPPQTMPWGWRCSFIRDPNGFLVELAREL
jgi:predicted enzyme related to lactoylglutathione lyase